MIKKILFILLLFPTIANAGSLLPYPLFCAVDGNGDPLRGGKLYTYEAGTTTAKDAYSDRAVTTAHDNPVVLDSEGCREIYLDGEYNLNLLTRNDAQVPGWPIDNVWGMNPRPDLGVSLDDVYDCDLGAAITAIGATATTLIIDCTSTLADDDDDILPATITAKCLRGGLIQGTAGGNTETLTVNGGFIAEGGQQCIGSNITTDFSGVDNPMDAETFATLEAAQESDAPYLRINSASWSISAAVTFDQNDQIVEFVGPGKVSTTDDTVSGLIFSGNNATIIKPRMDGPGTFVLDGSTEAALIYITGNDSEVIGGYLVDPPTVGIYVDDGDRANIHHVRIDGGQSAYSDTEHFGIKVEDSLNSKATNCIIWNCVQGIKSTQNTGTQRHFEIANNHLIDNYDHAIYGGGGVDSREHFHDNLIYHSVGNTAMIGYGSFGSYDNNNIYSTDSGITLRNPVDSTVTNNTIIITATTAETGIALGRITTDGSITGCNVSNNTINFTSTGSSDGIQIASTGAGTFVNTCTIANNTVYGSNQTSGNASLFIDSIGSGENNIIIGNKFLSSTADGIELQNVRNTIISNNIIDAADSRGMQLLDTAWSTVMGNAILDEVGSVTSNGILESSTSFTGTHDGAGNAATLSDSGATFTTDAFIGLTIYNTTDSSSAVVTDNNGTTVTATLAGGTDNDWDIGDTYLIGTSNQYIHNLFNLNGLGGSSVINTQTASFSFAPTPNGKTQTLAGHATFALVDGNIHIIDPTGNRNFNPSGDFPIGYTMTVVNTADAAETITFDSTGLNQAIAQNERGIFAYSGTAWVLVNLY